MQTCLATLKCIEGLSKKQVRTFEKLSKSYLLDKLEVNTKARCVLAWAGRSFHKEILSFCLISPAFASDPNYTGFKPLADDHRVSVGELIESRAIYFPEGTQVASQFIASIVTDRQQFYEDKKELRQIYRCGFVFFVATCILDFIVGSI